MAHFQLAELSGIDSISTCSSLVTKREKIRDLAPEDVLELFSCPKDQDWTKTEIRMGKYLL